LREERKDKQCLADGIFFYVTYTKKLLICTKEQMVQREVSSILTTEAGIKKQERKEL
jgi:hypothetical protein